MKKISKQNHQVPQPVTRHPSPVTSRTKTKRIPQDIIGTIAILKFPRKTLWLIKKLKAIKFLKQNKTITTVLEKTEGFSGELRTLKTKHLAGIKTKQTTYKENQCIFKFDVDQSYFSPRLSNERKIIANQIEKLVPAICNLQSATTKSKTFRILVMFAGIAPYPIVIAKKLKQAGKKTTIISNEFNRQANIEAKKNIALNKLQNYITIIPGDAKKLPELLTKLNKSREKRAQHSIPNTKYQIPNTDNIENFDIILMPRPNLDNTFLKTALKLSKKGTTIFYHGFGTKEEVLKEIKDNTKNKIGKINIRKAGDIGPYKFRWQAIFKVK